MRPIIEIPKKELEIQYLKNNKPVNEIANNFGCSTTTVYNAIRKYGISKRKIDNKPDIIGKKYNWLTVIAFHSKKNKQNYWLCRCDCGNERICQTSVLNQGQVKQCTDCRLDKAYKAGKHLTGHQFGLIKKGARDRKIPFLITIEDIEQQYEKQNKKCALSGVSIVFNSSYRYGIIKDGKKCIIRGTASIDRIDNNGFYTKDNIQIVHKDLNYMKRCMSNDDFIDMCVKVAINKGVKGIEHSVE